MDINIFTAAMRAEFLNAMQAVGTPAPVDKFTTVVPSTARIENYTWMTPAPGISRYAGFRRLAQMAPVKYSVENLEYDGAFAVPTRDVEDDQVGGYKLRMKDLVQKADQPFRSRLLLTTLAAGKTNTCFDGTAFFATSHAIGGVGSAIPGTTSNTTGNLLGYVSSNTSDAVVHRFVLLIHKSGMLNPLIYQNRKSPEFNTDAGSPESRKAKKAEYWIDLEAAAAYGYWWDAVMVEITNTPSVDDIWKCIDIARQALMGFTLPKALATDPNEYPHEQIVISPESCTIACSVGLSVLFDRAIHESYFGVSTGGATGIKPNNLYYGKFNVVTSNYLNS